MMNPGRLSERAQALNAFFPDPNDGQRIAYVLGRVALYEHQVGSVAYHNGPTVGQAKPVGRNGGCCLQGFKGGKTGLHQQFQPHTAGPQNCYVRP